MQKQILKIYFALTQYVLPLDLITKEVRGGGDGGAGGEGGADDGDAGGKHPPRCSASGWRC